MELLIKQLIREGGEDWENIDNCINYVWGKCIIGSKDWRVGLFENGSAIDLNVSFHRFKNQNTYKY